MKLVVQIPCYNEAQGLAKVLPALPVSIPGIDEIVVVVLDDGSTDGTADVATGLGAHVSRTEHNLGLARTFVRGLDYALALGADIIVNTDGDNQYCGSDIPKLVDPVRMDEADLVIGNRHPEQVTHFSRTKRVLQALGNRTISWLAGIPIPDGVSGFRAYSRSAALQLSIHSDFSYTLESLLQGIQSGLRVQFVDIQTNQTLRPSRLSSNMGAFLFHQAVTVFRTLTVIQPVRTFGAIGILLGIPGLALGIRFLYHLFAHGGAGYIQSLILTAILLVCSFVSFLFAFAMDVVANYGEQQRKVLTLLRSQEFDRLRAGPTDPCTADADASDNLSP